MSKYCNDVWTEMKMRIKTDKCMVCMYVCVFLCPCSCPCVCVHMSVCTIHLPIFNYKHLYSYKHIATC